MNTESNGWPVLALFQRSAAVLQNLKPAMTETCRKQAGYAWGCAAAEWSEQPGWALSTAEMVWWKVLGISQYKNVCGCCAGKQVQSSQAFPQNHPTALNIYFTIIEFDDTVMCFHHLLVCKLPKTRQKQANTFGELGDRLTVWISHSQEL